MDQIKTGAFIAAARREKSITQDELGRRLGVSQRTVSRWETGRNMPDMSILQELCDTLGISIQEFMDGERNESESFTKEENDNALRSLLALTRGRKDRKRIAGAIVSFVLMAVCMIGYYNMGYPVSMNSTAGLEAAIDEYGSYHELRSDVLEVENRGSDLFVLYRHKDDEKSGGYVRMKKGIFGKYRVVNLSDSNYPLINSEYSTAGGKPYLIAYSVNDLPGVDSYSLCGPDGEIVFSSSYTGSPFITIEEDEPGNGVVYKGTIYYDKAGNEIGRNRLESLFEYDDSASWGVGSGGIWNGYFLEIIILLLGVIMIRYFLSDGR